MRFTFSLFLTMLFATGLWAQPTNDECGTFIDIGIVPSCTNTVYTSVDATTSDIGASNVPSCFNNGVTLRDVFFSFTPDTDITDYTIRIQGIADGPNGRPLTNPQFTLYRGADCSALSEIVCAAAGTGSTVVSAVVPIPLTAGTNYFLRINDYSNSAAPNWGDFTICIEEYVAPIVMGDTPTTSRCEGTVYDSGGNMGNYDNDLNQTLTICPNDPHECIAFDVESFGILGQDALNIYAGNGTGGELVATLNGTSSGEDFRIFVNTNDCATLEFTSDAFTTGEGFILNWQCSATACNSSLDNPISIPSIPFNGNFSTCTQGATFNSTSCLNAPFLNGPEMVFTYEAPGGFCANIDLLNEEPGTGFVVLDAPPTDPDANCVRVSTTGTARGVDFQIAGTYYIVVANAFGCSNFGIRIEEGPCTTATSLVDALCNPLNGCIQDGDLTTTFRFEDDNQDLELNDANSGCWGGVGAEADFFWFTIQAQADGPFGFILQSSNVPSDIDFNVWGPFTEDQVCESSSAVIDLITNGEPIRSSYAGGTEPTGLADIHPEFGYVIEDDYDCQGNNDDIVRTIPAVEGEVYVVLVNDWGDNILDGAIQVDWSPSEPLVLDPIELDIVAGDTSVCANQPVPIIVETRIDNITWIGDNVGQLSCTDCFMPIATPSETTTYRAVLNTECTTDTIEVNVEVFDLDAGPDFEVCQNATLQIPAGPDYETATYTWTPPAGLTFSCTDCPTPMVTTSAPGVYAVPVVLDAGACRFTDEIIITVVPGQAPDIAVADDVTICRGESTEIGSPFVDGQVYNWVSVPVDPNLIISAANPDVSPDVTTTYVLTVTSGDCPVSLTDSVTITVEQPPLVGIVQQDIALCEGDTAGLSNVIFEQGVDYNWTGPSTIFNPEGPGTLIAPSTSGTYRLTASRGECSAEATTEVTVTPIALDLNQPDTVMLCLGEEIPLAPTVEPSTATIVWNQADVSGNSPTLAPTQTTTYIAMLDNGACMLMDTLYVQVDSLPQDMSITAEPEKDPYCQGELVQLTSPIYDPFDFPSITFLWEGPGQETADSLYNMVVTTVDTFHYTRTTTVGACMQVDSILLNVFRNDLTITPDNPEICPGASVQLEVTSSANELGELTWTPEDGLSCTDCPNPIATPSATTTYTVESSAYDCTTEASVTISIIEPPTLALIDDQLVCTGTSLQLNNVVPSPGATYTWSSSIDPNFMSDVPNLTIAINETVTYTVTANNECGDSITDEVTITVVDAGEVANVSDPIRVCAGETFNLSAEIENSNNAPFISIVWNYGGNSKLGADVSFEASSTGVAQLIYQYGLDDDTLCEVIMSEVQVTVDEIPSIELTEITSVCASDASPITLNTAPSEEGVTYSWSSPDDPNFTSSEANPVVTPISTTSYEVTASNGTCSVTESVTINVVPINTIVSITQGPLRVCAGETIDLAAEVSSTGTNEVITAWNYLGEVVNSSTAQFIATQSGTATFTYAYGNDDVICETITATVEITVDQAPVIDLIPDATTCFGDGEVFVLNNLTAEAGVSYNWTSPDDETFSDVMADPEVSPTTTTTYELEATIGNCTVNGAVTINVIPPVSLVAGEDQVVTVDDPIANLSATVEGDGGTGAFVWTIVEGTEIGQTSSVDYTVSPLEPQTAVVTYNNGCQILTDTVEIVGLDYRVPNFFSPNGDNTNDVFRPYFTFQADAVEVFVYNRWGQLVFEGSGTTPEAYTWDGQVNGKPAPADVYLYKVTVSLDGVDVPDEGEVTLAR